MERISSAPVPPVDGVSSDAATVAGMAIFHQPIIEGSGGRVRARERGYAMRQVQDTVLRRITRALHDQFQEIAHEPLPRRWVDLIHHLDEQERNRSEPPEAGAEPSIGEDRRRPN